MIVSHRLGRRLSGWNGKRSGLDGRLAGDGAARHGDPWSSSGAGRVGFSGRGVCVDIFRAFRGEGVGCTTADPSSADASAVVVFEAFS